MDYEEERLDKVRILTFLLEELAIKDGSYEQRSIIIGGTHFLGKLIEGVELKQESEPEPELTMEVEQESVKQQLTGSQGDANFHLHKAKVFHSSMWVHDINLASYHIDQAYRIDPSDKEIIQVKNNVDETKNTLEKQISSSNKILNSVSTHDKRYLHAMINKGTTLMKLGELDEAVETCKKALSIQQDMTAYHCMMSSLVAQAQRNQNWEEVLKQGEFFSELTLRDISHEASIGRLHLTGIVAWYHLEKYDEVLALLDAQESSTSNKNSKDFLKSLQIATLEKMGRQAEADLMLLPNPFGETEYQKFSDYDSKIYSYTVLSDWEKVRYYIEKIEKEYPEVSFVNYSSMKAAAYYYLEQQSPTKQIEDVFSVVFGGPESKSVLTLIQPLYIIIGVVAIGGIIGAIAVAKRGSKTPKPTKQKPKPVKQKPAKEKETSEFCIQCGAELNPKAKFCGSCGTSVP
jgi:tetratricopeptide (TPR) repeat protein